MANAGKNTQSSQFFITTAATPFLNGTQLVFLIVCVYVRTYVCAASVKLYGNTST